MLLPKTLFVPISITQYTVCMQLIAFLILFTLNPYIAIGLAAALLVFPVLHWLSGPRSKE